MTCIVAIKEEGKLFFGADSFISDSETDIAYPMKSPKVFRNGEFLFAYCGSVRAGKIFQYDLQLPEPDLHHLDKYMNTEFITALGACSQKNKLITDENDKENDLADLIVGIDGRLFEIQSHSQAIELYVDYMSLGSGSKFALGSLHTTSTLDISPKERLRLALEASAAYSMTVGKPFNYLSS